MSGNSADEIRKNRAKPQKRNPPEGVHLFYRGDWGGGGGDWTWKGPAALPIGGGRLGGGGLKMMTRTLNVAIYSSDHVVVES